MKTIILAAAALATMAGGVAMPGAADAAPPRGSYRDSCRSVRERGNVLSAECRDTRGRYRDTTLRYRDCVGDIGNNNGQLVCNRRPGGGGPGWGGGGPGNGGPGWGNNGRLPGGSWARSCRGGQMRGTVLSARRDGGRGNDSTSLDMRQCRTGNAGNRNGRLVCE